MLFLMGGKGNGKSYFIKYNLKTFEINNKNNNFILEFDFNNEICLNYDIFIELLEDKLI